MPLFVKKSVWTSLKWGLMQHVKSNMSIPIQKRSGSSNERTCSFRIVLNNELPKMMSMEFWSKSISERFNITMVEAEATVHVIRYAGYDRVLDVVTPEIDILISSFIFQIISEIWVKSVVRTPRTDIFNSYAWEREEKKHIMYWFIYFIIIFYKRITKRASEASETSNVLQTNCWTTWQKEVFIPLWANRKFRIVRLPQVVTVCHRVNRRYSVDIWLVKNVSWQSLQWQVGLELKQLVNNHG